PDDADKLATAGETATASTSPDAATAPASALPSRKSIAVLPFVNMSADAENEYFSDGITEDILTRLSKVSGLRVISRTSVIGYKNTTKTVPQIATELGVAHVLEGSVRRAGNRVRISVQLIDAATDEHLWAETYDRELTDVFAIQSEISRHITDALQVQLSRAEGARLARSGTGSLAAYDLYLKGRDLLRRPTTGPQEARDNVNAAMALFREALREDTAYALAYAGLAQAYGARTELPMQARYDSAVAMARRAIRLDPELAEGHAQLGFAYAITWDWDRSDAEMRRALELDPNHTAAISALAEALVGRGELAAALRERVRAVRLEPTEALRYFEVGYTYRLLGDYDRWWQWSEKGYRLAPEQRQDRECGLVWNALFRRRPEEGDRKLREMLAEYPDHWWALFCAGTYEVARGHFAAAQAHLERYAAMVPEEEKPYESLGYVLGKLGEPQRADSMLALAEARARQRLRGNEGTFIMARVLALRGRREEALSFLQRRIDTGWYGYYVQQPFWYFESLQGDPRYERMMAGVKARVDREREKARAQGL
ncbi:MAG TPA: hypothetical protein VEW03_05530, partial [Longimicrobiaceae bacterium]|nr:hypothetical protein [Longimicrobiaceae bacterium]